MPTNGDLIIVVEDDLLIAELVATTLTREGYAVATFTRGFAGLLQPEPWEHATACVVDWMLPGITGGEILAYVAENHPSVRRVIYSAIGNLDVIDRSLYDQLVTKPGGPNELVAAVRG